MKKIFWFIGLSILLFLLFLILTNWGSIWSVLVAFPLDRIGYYLAGALTAFLSVGLSSNFRNRKNNNQK